MAPRERTDLERAAGRLIAAVQKEWHAELGTPAAERSMNAMDRAHEIRQVRTAKQAVTLLGGNTVREWIGTAWVNEHPKVEPAIRAVQEVLASTA